MSVVIDDREFAVGERERERERERDTDTIHHEMVRGREEGERREGGGREEGERREGGQTRSHVELQFRARLCKRLV